MENLKIDYINEILVCAVSTRAATDVILETLADIMANQNGNDTDENLKFLIDKKNIRVEQIVDDMQKYI